MIHDHLPIVILYLLIFDVEIKAHNNVEIHQLLMLIAIATKIDFQYSILTPSHCTFFHIICMWVK